MSEPDLRSDETKAQDARVKRARVDERGRAARIADDWSKADVIRLRAGEMPAQEMRTAQAVARGIAAAIRGLG